MPLSAQKASENAGSDLNRLKNNERTMLPDVRSGKRMTLRARDMPPVSAAALRPARHAMGELSGNPDASCSRFLLPELELS